jgi:hypothetical protein
MSGSEMEARDREPEQGQGPVMIPKDCKRLAEVDFPIAELSPMLIEEGAASLRLAEAYLKARLVPPPRRNDARHIALATVADLDAIVSWNFRDMVNIRKKKIVHSVNAKFGYRLIDIISPLEVPRD